MENVNFSFAITKASKTGEFVRGFATVTSVDGKAVEDHQGDVVAIDDIRKAAHEFVTSSRVGKAMHKGEQVADLVESAVIDDEFAKELGLSDGRRGWWVGMRINDKDVRKRVVKGDLTGFSIGGRGVRKEIA